MINRSVPAFLKKLYNIVNDPQSNDLIIWSETGNSFIIKKPQEFAKEILPRFFKHNNLASFVRQLNLYGFHKIQHLQQGVLQPDEQSEQLEFNNTNFIYNQPDLLVHITRKKVKDNESIKELNEVDINHILNEITSIKEHQITTNEVDINHILGEIASIKKRQMIIDADLKNIQSDTKILCQEIILSHERYYHQQKTISKILQFLASVFSADKKSTVIPKKRKLLLENSDSLESSDQNTIFNNGQINSNEVDSSSLVLDINDSTVSTVNSDQSDFSTLQLLSSLLAEGINDINSLNLTQTSLPEIETCDDEVGSNINNLTTLGLNPNDDNNLENNSIENDFLSFYDMDFNPIEQDQLLFGFNLDENNNDNQ
jgi:hypothetical protein